MIGKTISHYRVLEKIGQGGMGEVYKAEDVNLGRHVALKFLTPALLGDDQALKRFAREARAGASLNHPNLCTTYEVGEHDGHAYLALALVEGETLAQRIARGPLTVVKALQIAKYVARALHHAHSNGVVHRDVKPSNIMVRPDGQPVLMDFGLATLREASRLTRPESVVGTVAYLSPEQVTSSQVDPRSDVWALGCVLQEMITGQPPFEREYHAAELYAIVNEDPRPLAELRPEAPQAAQWIVDKCLAKDVGERYQSAAELAVDLERARAALRKPSKAGLAGELGSGSWPPAQNFGTLERWWAFHQIAVIVFYSGMTAFLWKVKMLERGLDTLIPFLGAVASGSVNAILRAHLLFTSRFNREALAEELTHTAPWVRRADWIFVLLLAAAAAAVSLQRQLIAAGLAGAAVGYAAVFLKIEPTTAKAVFRRKRATRSG